MKNFELFIKILRTKYGFLLDTLIYNRIDASKLWFDGTTTWHNRTIDNGVIKVSNKIVSSSFASNICRDRSLYTVSDNIDIRCKNDSIQEYLELTLDKLNFKTDIVLFYERVLALGACATELVFDTCVSNNIVLNIENMDINYIQSDAVFPITYSGNDIKEVAFAFPKTILDNDIVDVRLHLLNDDNTYRIENHRYILSKLKGWYEWLNIDDPRLKCDYVPVMYTGSTIPLFQIWRAPETDPYTTFGLNPLGILIIYNNIELFEQLDLALDTLLRDTALGLPLILCNTSILPEDKNHPGKKISPLDLRQLLYQWIPTEQNDQKPYEVLTHDLHSTDIITLIDKIISMILDNCGLGLNFYSNNKFNKTATEILVDNLTLERTIKRSILLVKKLIKQLCNSLLFIGVNYLGLSELNNYNIDDIEVDINIQDIAKETLEKEQMRQDVIDGIIPKEVYIEKYYAGLNIDSDKPA